MKSALLIRPRCLLSLLVAGLVFTSGAVCDAADAASPELSGRSLEVSVEDGKLTLNSDGASLKSILEELARQARLRVHIPDVLEQRPVSISLQQVPLEKGISRLLKGMSYTMVHDASSNAGKCYEVKGDDAIYRAGPGIDYPPLGELRAGTRVSGDEATNEWQRIRLPDDQVGFVSSHSLGPANAGSGSECLAGSRSPRLVEIRVLSSGTGRAALVSGTEIDTSPPLRPIAVNTSRPERISVDPSDGAALKGEEILRERAELLEALLTEASTASDPEDKAKALVSLTDIDPDDPRVRDVVLDSLRDPDRTVREGALHSLMDVQWDLPVEVLVDMALHDEDTELRLVALHLASMRLPHDQAADLLQDTRHDRDPWVGDLAKEMLKSFEDDEADGQ